MITVNYREVYGIYACNGILFNHESPVRGETFVTRKITRALTRIKLGSKKRYLGNLDALRDWGMQKICRGTVANASTKPDDFVIATGKQYSVRDFIKEVLKLRYANRMERTELDEVGLYEGKDIKIDPRYFRPTEVETLLGDASKAKEKLNWVPKISFEQLVKEMVEEDLKSAKNVDLINK